MCGRYTIFDIDKLAPRFDLAEIPEGLGPHYNVAPTQTLPVIVAEGSRNVAKLMRWGLIPFWAKDMKIAYKTINARAEGLEDKASYRRAFKSQRCIVPASGFYEWQKREGGKQPYFIRLKDHELFGFAGLWESWRNDKGEDVHTYTIITTTPNTLMEPIHDRMPAILRREHEEPWLDPALNDVQVLHSFLTPYPAGDMEAQPVSDRVNAVKTQGSELIARINQQPG